eukprot:scaffold21.g2167.t1
MRHHMFFGLLLALLAATATQARLLQSDDTGGGGAPSSPTPPSADAVRPVLQPTRVIEGRLPDGRTVFSSSTCFAPASDAPTSSLAVPAAAGGATGTGGRRLLQPGSAASFQQFVQAAQTAPVTNPAPATPTAAAQTATPATAAAAQPAATQTAAVQTTTAQAANTQQPATAAAATTTQPAANQAAAAAAAQQAAAQQAAAQQAAAQQAAVQQAAAQQAAAQQAAAQQAAAQQAAAQQAAAQQAAAQQAAAAAGGGATCGDGQDCLSAQNAMRARHGAAPMAWSPALAAQAQAWASGCSMWHSGAAGVGENIAWGPGLGSAEAIGLWLAEESLYRRGRGYQHAAAHYTQIVWQPTSEVGCGTATCGAQNFVVCNYQAPGNFVDQMDLYVH